MDIMSNELLPYKIGGLLYTPATNKTIADKLIHGTIKNLTSLVFCLEDSIGDNEIKYAEENLKNIFCCLRNVDDLPLLFVRIRSPQHLRSIFYMLGEDAALLTGFVLPKFDNSIIDEYINEILTINASSAATVYVMPIIESRTMTKGVNRAYLLEQLKESMARIKKYIINVRVGGNDFTNIYGLRRNVHQNIYQIGVVRDILIDILNVFSDEYIVSGPVWEYYDNNTDDEWKIGLENELELDRLNGFIGKTAIHPSQLPVIYNSMKPSRGDYNDAKLILNWKSNSGVSGNSDGKRMNEVKTHRKWAERIFILGELYGCKEDENR